MNKISVLILSIVILLSSLAKINPAQTSSGWEYLNFVPNELHSVSFPDSLNGWAVNSSELIHTTDGGKTWFYQKLERESGQFMDNVFFIDKDVGWIAGNEIWHTEDGGKTWENQTDGTFESYQLDFSDIFFLNKNRGWACGDSSLIIETSDGGANWVKSNYELNDNSFHSILFRDSYHGWLWNQFTLQKTINSGSSWDTIYTNKDYTLYSVYFADTLNGWAGCNDGLILRTTDGGNSWDSSYVTTNVVYRMYISGIHFTDRNNGICIGSYVDNLFNSSAVIYKTEDGGETWNYAEYNYSLAGLNSLAYAEGNYICVGENSILRSTDLGTNWTNKLSELKANISKIYFADENNGWATGETGEILRTTDGGINWDVTIITNNGFSGGAFIDESTGWAFNNNSVIHTTDGGINWIEQSVPAEFDTPFSICFTDKDYGWAVGWNSPVIKTTDGGENWDPATVDKYNLRNVFFTNRDYGYATRQISTVDTSNIYRDFGSVLTTTNGGTDWKEIILGEGYNLTSVFFIDSRIGWIIGYNYTTPSNFILKTTDGGQTWDRISELTHRANDIFFTDAYTGWFTTGRGNIFSSSDGGSNWIEQFTTPKVAALNSIYFIDENNGWAAGEDGTILKTTNGGVTEIDNKENTAPPLVFSLAQNYPNPFNLETTISYSIPVETGRDLALPVNLSVYNILGQKITTPVNKIQRPGKYVVEFNGGNLPSGIYFYRITVQNYSETKKMILLR